MFPDFKLSANESSTSASYVEANAANVEELADEQQWKVYLNNSASLRLSWNSDQERYAKLCFAAVDAASQLFEDKHVTVKTVYQFLAAKRHAIAIELHQDQRESIGIRRDTFTKALTPMHSEGRYKDFFIEVKDRILDLYNMAAEERKNFILRKDIRSGDFRPGKVIVIKDGGIELTEITKPTEDQLEILINGQNFKFIHTKEKFISVIYAKINKLFKAILEDPLPSSKNMIIIGEMAWYLAHAMPCKRGSAATTEMFVRLLMKKIGLPSVPYKHHIPLDFEALIEPDKNKFIYRFTNAFYPQLVNHYTAHIEKPTSLYTQIQTNFYSSGQAFFRNANKATKRIKENIKIINNLSI